MTPQENVFVKPDDQSQTSLSFGMARKGRKKSNLFFHLLRCGLWNTPAGKLPEPLPTQEEWQGVWETARRQTVRGLLWSAIGQLPREQRPPQPMMWTMLAAVDAIERSNVQMASAVGATRLLLEQEGVEPILMKGMAVGLLYTHPEWRECGDIDWFIPSGQVFKNLPAQLRRQGYAPTASADGSLSFDIQDVEVELHQQLIDIEAPQCQKVLSKLIAEEGVREIHTGDGTVFSMPSPMLSLIMLNAHLMKHAFTVGIGLRQFCDMARAYHTWHVQYDADRLTYYYKRLGLHRWTGLMHSILTDYLGLPAYELPSPLIRKEADSQRLMKAILEEGNFGQHTIAWQRAADNHANIKRHTVKQILRKMPFSMRYAPWEMICKIGSLTLGQWKKA